MVQNNPIRPQDKVMVSLLKSLGIEKGKPFNPTEEQKRAMNEGLQLAYAAMQSFFTTPGQAMIPLWKGKSQWQVWNFARRQPQAGLPPMRLKTPFWLMNVPESKDFYKTWMLGDVE